MPVRLRSLRFLNSPISARAKIFWGLIHQNKKRGISRFGVRAKYKPQELVRSTFRTTGSGMESPCGCSGKLYHSAGSTDNFVFLSACTFPSCREGITWGFGHSHFCPLTAGSGSRNPAPYIISVVRKSVFRFARYTICGNTIVVHTPLLFCIAAFYLPRLDTPNAVFFCLF